MEQKSNNELGKGTLNRKRFECKKCKRVFKTPMKLNKHIIIDHECDKVPNLTGTEETFKCSICSEHFTDRKEYYDHVNCHLIQKAVICDICDVEFNNELYLEVHKQRMHSSNSHPTCTECRQVFDSEDGLNKHFEEKHMISYERAQEEKFVCSSCDQFFNRKIDLYEHYPKCKFPKTAVNIEKRKRYVKNVNPQNLINCELCNKTLAIGQYDRHIKTIHPVDSVPPCPFCQGSFSTLKELEEHIADSHPKSEAPPNPKTSDNKKSYDCKYCGRILCSAYSLRNHLEIHEKPKILECKSCSLRFRDESKLKNHICWKKDILNLPKSFICDFCGKGFDTNKKLYNHKATHTRDKFHKCAYCEKSFARRTYLEAHKEVHRSSAEKTISCQHCNMSFSDSKILRFHEVKLHNFRCNLCGKIFSHSYKLAKHKDDCDKSKGLKIINECVDCSEIFDTKAKLEEHSRNVHTKESNVEFVVFKLEPNEEIG